MNLRRSRSKILIVSPMKDEAENIHRIVESVAEQNFSDWQWLIFNNASTDDTLQKLEALCANESRIRVINSELSLTAAESFSTTMSLAAKFYEFDAILPLAGDDFFGSNHFLSLANCYLELGHDLVIPKCILWNPYQKNSQIISYSHMRENVSRFELMLWHAIERSYGNIFYSVISKELFFKFRDNKYAYYSSEYRSDWWNIHYMIQASLRPIIARDLIYVKSRHRNIPYDSAYYMAGKNVKFKKPKLLKKKYSFQEDFEMLFQISERFPKRRLPFYLALFVLMVSRTLYLYFKERFRRRFNRNKIFTPSASKGYK